MPKKILITTTSDLPKIKTLARHSKTADIRLRWQIIYTLIADNRSTSLIAVQLGCSKWLVRDSAKKYNSKGFAAFDGPGSGYHRSRFHLDLSKEKEILNKFIPLAKSGTLTTYRQIKHQIEKEIGKKVNKTVIYRMLKRHGWRKISPRPSHPKADQEKQAEFKKNSHLWLPPL